MRIEQARKLVAVNSPDVQVLGALSDLRRAVASAHRDMIRSALLDVRTTVASGGQLDSAITGIIGVLQLTRASQWPRGKPVIGAGATPSQNGGPPCSA